MELFIMLSAAMTPMVLSLAFHQMTTSRVQVRAQKNTRLQLLES